MLAVFDGHREIPGVRMTVFDGHREIPVFLARSSSDPTNLSG